MDKLKVVHSPLGLNIGYHTIIYDEESNQSLGGGTGKTQDESYRVALSEMHERRIVNNLMNDKKLRKEFYLDTHPTSCGFAFGFSEKDTLLRSVFESVERYIFGHWIDNGYYIPEIKNVTFTPFYSFFSQFFNEVKAYFLEMEIDHPILNRVKIKMGITLGLTDTGIYPGSRVDLSTGEVFEHAIVESWRHKKIAEIGLRNPKDDFIEKKIIYFSQNKKAGLEQIPTNREKNAALLKPKFYKPKLYADDECQSYLWRNLCHNYLNWEKGEINRFVY